MLYFELCYYVDVQDPLNCPQYTGEQLCTQPIKLFCFSDFASAWCQRPPVKFWMVSMVRTWSVSFSGLLLWFLSLQLGLFDTNRSQVWDLKVLKILIPVWILGETTCAPVYKKLITCFPKAQHFVGTRPRLWLIKRPVFPSDCVQRFGKGQGGLQTAEDFVSMLWGWSIPLQLHIISTLKAPVLNYILWT